MLPDNDAGYTVHGMVLAHMSRVRQVGDVRNDESGWLATCLCGWFGAGFQAKPDLARAEWSAHKAER